MDHNPYDLGNFIIVYQYYSTLTLSISWMLAPLTFYIILTQSKSLGQVKWLFLNQSFWCLMLETLLGIVKPVLFGDVASGYSVGLFRNTDFRSSAITALLCLLFILYSIGGLVMTIQNRYATIFDVKMLKKISETKNMMIIVSILYVSMTIVCFVVVLPTVFIEKEQIYKWAREYNTELVPYFEQPTFFIVPHEMTDIPIIIALSTLLLIIVLCVVSGVTFIYSLKSVKTKVSLDKKVQRSIMLSAIVQMLLTVFFLFFPIVMFFCYIIFEVQYSGKSMQVFMCMLTSHCYLDFIATLYFVIPYRRFIMKKLPMKTKLESTVIQKSYGNNPRVTISTRI